MRPRSTASCSIVGMELQHMELSPALRALLERPAFGHVITMNRDGSPQVTLVWMDVHNGRPAFNTATGRQKDRNLARDGRVMVSVQNPDNPAEYALIEGTARVSEDADFAHINRLARKFVGRDYSNRSEQRISVEIDITRVTGRGPWVG